MKQITFILFFLVGTIGIAQPANDLCDNAIQFIGNSTISGTSVGASIDSVVFCGTAQSSPSVWYSYVDTSGVTSTATISTCIASSFDTKISVYRGVCGSLICVGGNDDNCPNFRSEFEFNTDGSSTYYFLVHGFSTATGTFDLTFNRFPNTAPTITCPSNITMVSDASVCGRTINYSVSANDAEDGSITPTLEQGIASGGFFPVGTTLVEYSVTDTHGHIENCSFEVTITDSEDPVANAGSITISLDATGNASITALDIENGSTDNCGIISSSIDVSNFTCNDIATNPNSVLLTVTDAAGNTDTMTGFVTVEDTTAPTIVCQNNTVQLDVNGTASITTAIIDNGTTDACSTPTLTLDITTFDCSNIGSNTVTLTATDAAGNTSSCTAIVTVADIIAPVVACQDIIVQLDANGMATITAADIDNGSTDNCSISSLTLDVVNFSCDDLGDTTVQLTATDGSGNTNSCTAIVTVVDDISPSVSCPQNQTVLADVNGNFVLPDYDATGDLTFSDNCEDGVVVSQNPAAGTIVGLGVTTVSFIVEDEAENQTSCAFDLTVEEVLAVSENTLSKAVTLSPNPANNVVKITSNLDLLLNTIEVYNVHGKSVIQILPSKNSKYNTLQISHLKAGVYFVAISTQNKTVIKKLIKL